MMQLLLIFIIIIIFIILIILACKKFKYYNFESFSTITNDNITCNRYYKTACPNDCNPGFIKCSACGLSNCNDFCLINKPRPTPRQVKVFEQSLNPNMNKQHDCPICEPTICPKCPECPPPCPDKNLYIKKCDIKSCPPLPDLDDYILKSQVPKCPKCPDLSKYILIDDIPKCKPCPGCIDCNNFEDHNLEAGCCLNRCPKCLPCQPQLCPKSDCLKLIYLPNTKQEYYTIDELENIVFKSKINFKNSPCQKKINESNNNNFKCLLSEPKAYNSI